MTKLISFSILYFLLHNIGFPQSDSLKAKIESSLAGKKATIGISIIGPGGKDTLSINGNKHFPMQSVFKFHIALCVLSQVDEKKLMLDQKIRIEKEDMLPETWSPIRLKYPDGTELTLAEVIRFTVAESDNNGCDILLRLVGGPKVVNNFFMKKGFSDISIVANEEEMRKDWETQFKNWTTPESATRVLKAFYEKKVVSEKSTEFLYKVMTETTTGRNRIPGKLPDKTPVAHKTGSSGANDKGITAAVNDIGIITLPGGKVFYISLFVTDAKESPEGCEMIIADMTKLSWDYFTKKRMPPQGAAKTSAEP
jgi:beta-lactamase class A